MGQASSCNWRGDALALAAPVVAAGMAGNYLAGKALTPFAEKIGMPYAAQGMQYGGSWG